MDPQLHAMNGAKTSSSFTVKDILDLPKGKSSCSPVDSTTNTVNAASLSSIPSVPEVPDITSVGGYYDADNPYTRWLHNNENMYSRKLFFHQNLTLYSCWQSWLNRGVFGWYKIKSNKNYHIDKF